MRWWLLLLLAGALLSGAPAARSAQGEHARRAAAELLVLHGDVQRLAGERLSARHLSGLRDRVAGGLAGLGLLLRLATQESAVEQAAPDTAVLWRLFERNAYLQLLARLEPLVARYPLDTSGLLPPGTSPERLARARALHQRFCFGCHDTPYLDTERPAYNLFEQAQRLPLPEFTARMLVGIRGDRITAIDNPFSDAELQALITLYRARQGD